MGEKKNYVIEENDIARKIAEYETMGEYAIAKGLVIAAQLAGINIASISFNEKISDMSKKEKNYKRY